MKTDKRIWLDWKIWIQAMAVFGLVFFGGGVPVVRNVENMVFDLWTKLLVRPQAPQDLVIVAVDEPSFQELRLAWPWPRRLHARLVEELSRAGAKAIVFDIVFADPGSPEDDAALARAVRESGRVVLASTMDVADSGTLYRKIQVQPLADLRQGAEVGLAMITPDSDGVVRRFACTIDVQPTLPAAARSLAYPDAPIVPESGYIAFAGPSMTVPQISYYQALDAQCPLPRERIAGKVVFVGRSLAASPDPTSATDSFRTPFTAFDGRYMAGVEIHANILNTLMHGPVGRDVADATRLAVIAFVVVLASVLMSRRSVLYTVGWGIGLAVAVFGSSFAGYALVRLWFPPVGLASGIVLMCGWTLAEGYRNAARQRAWIRNAFGKYISPAVVEMLVNRPELLVLGGVEVEATVLFMDLEGFTTLSEKLSPSELVALLSEVFAPMSEVIKHEGGTLDKFIGDAIMAFWGAPVPMPDHAARACRAALAMQGAMRELAEGMKQQGGPQIRARIGMHSGPLVVGNIGSREQFNYTCLGDTVNLASRLEAVNKVYGTRIMVSMQTAAQLGDEFLIRPVDLIQVKGRREPVRVVEVIGPAGPDFPQWIKIYEEAHDLYTQGQFAAAADLFAEVLAQRPDDAPSRVLRARCVDLQNRPPLAWIGVWSAETGIPMVGGE